MCATLQPEADAAGIVLPVPRMVKTWQYNGHNVTQILKLEVC